MIYLLVFVLLLAGGVFYFGYKNRVVKIAPETYLDLDTRQKEILIDKVPFYEALDTTRRKHFDFKIQEFFHDVKITGIGTEIEEVDRLLIAASAIIPIFSFPKWRYSNLKEVILYPTSFNHDFETDVPYRPIMGMVGTGMMAGKMLLSKVALHHGFSNETDKKNTAVHEFVHLVDGLDGEIDGVPKVLLEKEYIIPWLDLMAEKIKEIEKRKSDINSYGGTSKIEFFAVASEYFFERPKLLKKKHPKVYEMLSEIFETE